MSSALNGPTTIKEESDWIAYNGGCVYECLDKCSTGRNCLMIKRVKHHIKHQEEMIEDFAHELEDYEERCSILYATIRQLRKDNRNLRLPKTLRSGTKY